MERTAKAPGWFSKFSKHRRFFGFTFKFNCNFLKTLFTFLSKMHAMLFDLICFVERCGAVVKRRTRDREVPGSIPTNCKCCFLEQETLSTLLSTGFYPGKKRASWKISTRLLNVLPSINKVDYYYYYYY